MITNKEREVLRTLASKWAEYASLPIMKERKRQWAMLNDLRAEKPMILVDTCTIINYIGENELHCEDQYLRSIERALYETVRHAEEIGDDIVVEPYFRVPWQIKISDYGVPLETYHAISSTGSDLGYSFNFPIRTPKDLSKLKPRTRLVDRLKTKQLREQLEEIFGDILEIKVSGFDTFFGKDGYNPWLGNLYGGLTMDLFKLIGNNNLLFWVYDSPETIHKLMLFLRDERIAYFKWMEKENMLYINTDTWNPHPGSYGYVSGLPQKDFNENRISLKDCWCWTDSQETTSISPKMFNEFFLPYMADVCKLFGLIYYGCCEGLHDRFKYVEKMIPNIRAVSVSGWSDLFKMGEMIDKKYVYSRKPIPAYISGDYPNWDLLKKDIVDTLKAAKNCNLEIFFRDIYTINGDRTRLSKWVTMVRTLANGL